MLAKKSECIGDTSTEKTSPSASDSRYCSSVSSPASVAHSEDQIPVVHTPSRLRHAILQHANDGIEDLLVASAQRCKGTSSNGYDFILIEVVDNRDPGHSRNPLELDYTSSGDNLLAGLGPFHDSLKISNDKDEQTLQPRRARDHYEPLESITFNTSTEQFPLYKLVVLADAASATAIRHDRTYGRQFATSVWSCLKDIQPTVRQEDQGKRAFHFSRSRRRIARIISRYDHEVYLFELELKRKESVRKT